MLRFAHKFALMVIAGAAIAHCCSTPSPSGPPDIGRLTGCKMSWVPGSGDVHAPTPRRMAVRGVYTQVEQNGVRARVIRGENINVLYARGWNEREAREFQGRRVVVMGSLQRPCIDSVHEEGDLRAMPFFREVNSIVIFN